MRRRRLSLVSKAGTPRSGSRQWSPAVLTSVVLLGACAEARRPGETLSADPQKVWLEQGCGSRKLPFLRLEANELRPATVRPGQVLDHRFIYSLCLPAGRTGLSGTLRTRVYRGRDLILSDGVPNYRVKPGRWTVDANIHVPSGAAEGLYTVRLDFAAGAMYLDGSVSLMVKK
jgi:hypothetical protein